MNSRLTSHYESVSELRQDDECHDDIIHYPPWVLSEILIDVEKITKEHQRPEGYKTVNEIAQKTGHRAKWINNRLEYLGIKPLLCFDSRNALSNHYPDDVIEQILSMPKDLRIKKSTTIGQTTVKVAFN